MKPPAVVAALCVTLAACGPGANDPGPADVTVGEAKALDEAAAMLDARRSPAAGAPLPPTNSLTSAP